ncbi:MAG: hypothetical protein FWH51_05405 [Dehalococcoidia bacterium]|nr:hypothetical protein [Dehalococcoidia bacterium]
MKRALSRFLLLLLAVVMLAVSGCQGAEITTSLATSVVTWETPTQSMESVTTVETPSSLVTSGPQPPTEATTLPLSPGTTAPISSSATTHLPIATSEQFPATILPSTTTRAPAIIVPIDPPEGPPWTLPASVARPLVVEVFTYDG